MKIFFESIKRSFKEIAGRWWFLLAFLSIHIVGITTSCVGIFLMFITGSDAYSGINYGWAIYLMNSIFSLPRAAGSSVGEAIAWILPRSFFLFVLYSLAYYFLGVVPTKARNDLSIRKILRNTATLFFAVNVIATIVASVISVIVVYITYDIFTPYLSLAVQIVFPFSFSTYVLIGALLNSKGSECDGKIVLRLIAFKYLLFALQLMASQFIKRLISTGSSTEIVVVVGQTTHMVDPAIIVAFIFSFLLFVFSLFVYAHVTDNERFLPSISKGIIFTFRHLQYALILGFVVYIFSTDSAIGNILWTELLHLPWFTYINFVSILYKYLGIVAVIIAFNFYRLKKVTQ